jgi:acetyl-CoA carboxylase beta subunit
MLSGKQGSAEMRKITFAVYNPPKEGLPYLAVMIAPNGGVAAAAAAAAYKTAAEAETYSLKIAMETAKVLR